MSTCRRFAVGGRVMLAVSAGLLVVASPAAGHDWYVGLVSPAGERCCSDRDCQPVDHRYDARTGALEVAVEEVWVQVDPRAVLPTASPDGDAHACFWRWWMVRKMTPMIRCVILPGDS